MTGVSNKQNTLAESKIFGDYLIMLAAPCVTAVWHYGARAVYVAAVSAVSAAATDFVVSAFLKKRFVVKDWSAAFTGLAIALMLPAGVPFYVPAASAIFAEAVVKIPFGGASRTPFSPVAAGFAFASVCFKDLTFDYAYNSADKFLGARSLGATLANGDSVRFDAANAFDIISGNVAGPMGTGCGILMLACCAYLFVRRRKTLIAAGGFLAACSLWALLFPRINAPALTSLALEASAGSLLFAAAFLVTDYFRLPKGDLNKAIFGAICGILCMATRAAGAYEETVCFAVLLADGASPLIESATRFASRAPTGRKKAAE